MLGVRPNPSQSTDSVGGHELPGAKRCPFSGVTMQFWQSLGDGAGKRCSECDSQASVFGIVSPSTANMLFIEVVREEYN